MNIVEYQRLSKLADRNCFPWLCCLGAGAIEVESWIAKGMTSTEFAELFSDACKACCATGAPVSPVKPVDPVKPVNPVVSSMCTWIINSVLCNQTFRDALAKLLGTSDPTSAGMLKTMMDALSAKCSAGGITDADIKLFCQIIQVPSVKDIGTKLIPGFEYLTLTLCTYCAGLVSIPPIPGGGGLPSLPGWPSFPALPGWGLPSDFPWPGKKAPVAGDPGFPGGMPGATGDPSVDGGGGGGGSDGLGTTVGTVGGAALGGMLAGPAGALLGGAIGGGIADLF